MKKLLITLMMVLTLSATAWAGGQHTKLRNLVSDYRMHEGFEVVDLGGIGMGLLKTAARMSVDSPEDRQALDLFKSIKRLTVVDFSDAEPAVRDKFLRKAKRILSEGEMLMEAKDEGETVRIYGVSSADGNLLEDVAILAADALIFVRGAIRMDQIATLMKQADRD